MGPFFPSNPVSAIGDDKVRRERLACLTKDSDVKAKPDAPVSTRVTRVSFPTFEFMYMCLAEEDSRLPMCPTITDSNRRLSAGVTLLTIPTQLIQLLLPPLTALDNFLADSS